MLLSKALIQSIFAVVEFFFLADIFFQYKRSVTRYEIIRILLARIFEIKQIVLPVLLCFSNCVGLN